MKPKPGSWAHATGLIMPRETSAIPGYSKWVEGLMTTGPLSHSAEKATRWPFVLAALLLVLALVGQVAFRFRSEIAVTAPSLRPLLEVLCRALDTVIPLPRHVELVSIETSDLQTDPARGSLLVLNATLRNRAGYGQAFPSLELSLTDTQDAAVARRVFAARRVSSSARRPAFSGQLRCSGTPLDRGHRHQRGWLPALRLLSLSVPYRRHPGAVL